MTEPTSETHSAGSLRRWLFLLLLVVLLLGINAVYPTIADQNPILSGAPGETLYVATFDAYFDAYADEWQQSTGRDSHLISDEGTMRIDVQTDSVIFAAAQPHFADFDASLTTQALAGSENNAFGLIFRLQQTPEECSMAAALLCGLSSVRFLGIGNWVRVAFEQDQPTRYYMFLISSDGYYSVWRDDGTGPSEISTWISSEAINLGLNAENRIRVVGQGATFQFFINEIALELCIPDDPDAQSLYYLGECVEGTMQRTLQEDTIATGQLAPVVVTGNALNLPTGVTVDFDNLVVLSPSNEVEGDPT